MIERYSEPEGITPESARKFLLTNIKCMEGYMDSLKRSLETQNIDPIELSAMQGCAENIAYYASQCEWENVVDWTPFIQHLKDKLR